MIGMYQVRFTRDILRENFYNWKDSMCVLCSDMKVIMYWSVCMWNSYPMAVTQCANLFTYSCYLSRACAQLLSRVWLFATTWTVAHQAPPLSMEFSRQGYWNGLLFPIPGDLPDPEMEPGSPALAGGFFTTASPRKLYYLNINAYLIHAFSDYMSVSLPVYRLENWDLIIFWEFLRIT